MGLKKASIIAAEASLSGAKLTNMTFAEKKPIILIAHKFKEVKEDFEKLVKDVEDKLKGDSHDQMVEKLTKWQQDGEKSKLTNEEKAEINRYINKFNTERNSILNEELEKEAEGLEFEQITEEVFGKFLDGNDLAIKDILVLQETIVKNQ